jgi:hypothetical protein
MNEQPPPPAPAPQETQPQAVISSTPAPDNSKLTEEQTTEALKEIQENAGQISELSSEEETLVKEFFNFLVRILKPFGKTLEISVLSLPESYNGRISKAYLYLTGQLVLVFKNDEVEILNLADQENHQILVDITGEIMTKLKVIITSHKSRTEKRVKFLMQMTKGLQKVAEVFSEDAGKK